MAGNRLQNLPESVVWVPCLPNYLTGELIPLYTINNFPSFTPPVQLKPVLSRGGLKSKTWTNEEDEKLIELVKELGTKKWAKIAREINKANNNWAHRKGKNCREHWLNHLNPDINSKTYIEGEWSYAEDLNLLKLHKEHGNAWSKISFELFGRTENSVKNRLNSLIKNAKQCTNSKFIDNETIVDLLAEQFEKLVRESN